MSQLTQVAFADVSFVDNPEPRCPCVLVLDVSGSMSGRPISELNTGLKQLQKELAADTLASRRVEIAVVTFGPVKVVHDFVSAESFQASSLRVEGSTPMGEAVLEALELVRLRKQQYQANGVAYYRPWVFLITDGAPTDDWHAAAKAVKDGEANRALAFFPVGVEGADMEVLRQLSARPPLKLKGLMFRELFQWLSNSLAGVSRSQVGERLQLAAPDTSASGWASIE
jgi:uncharacterized protein YegL